MTENEAISRIKDHMEIHRLKEPRAIYIIVALSMAIAALKEIQQYREIGTVEECREAREKQIPKAPIMKPYYEDMPDEEYLCCPTCGDILTDRIPDDNKNFYFHCLNCGQAFKWNDDNLEGMEDEH